MKERDRLIKFIEESNAFEVLGEFKRLGILSKEDVAKAMTLDRTGFLDFMKQRAGLSEKGVNDETED
jgi:hypothetical protein